jgi:hypothetical protein
MYSRPEAYGRLYQVPGWIPAEVLQEVMEHVSITTTLDLYGHLYPGDIDRYADRLDDAAADAGKAKIRPDDDEDTQRTT